MSQKKKNEKHKRKSGRKERRKEGQGQRKENKQVGCSVGVERTSKVPLKDYDLGPMKWRNGWAGKIMSLDADT